MSKRSNRLPAILVKTKAEKADNLIRAGSADFIMGATAQTVRKQGRQKPYSEGVANHAIPESCVGSREAGDEALTVGHIGRTLSGER